MLLSNLSIDTIRSQFLALPISQPVVLIPTLISSCRRLFNFPHRRFSRRFPNKILCSFLVFPILATYPALRIVLHFTILKILCGLYKSRSSSFHVFLLSSKFFLRLSFQTFVNYIFPTKKLRFRPHKANSKMIVLCVLVFSVLISRRVIHRFRTE